MKVHIKTLGCRTNQYDSAVIQALLEKAGHEVLAEADHAEAVIVNTCAVTSRAESKNGQALRRALKEHPGARVLAAGCGPAFNRPAYESIDGLSGIFGVNDGAGILKALGALSPEKTTPFDEAAGLNDRTRAHIKIQEGCDAFCAYCVVPFVRGAPVSRPADEIAAHAEKLIGLGFPELVLTGIHVGRYRDGSTDLGGLISRLASLKGDFRLRLSSIEPAEVTDRIVDLVLSDPKVCNHLHISLQSGDDRVLSAMNRRYLARDFFGLVERIRKKDASCGLGTDVIAGFPAEGEGEFRNTLERISDSGLTYGHVFPFSLRKGTAAEKYAKQVAPQVKAGRCRLLKETFTRLKSAFAQTLVGREARVVAESGKKALASNYLRVILEGKTGQGKLFRVRITGAENGDLKGRPDGDA